MADVFVRAARLIDAGGFAAVQRRSWLAADTELRLPPPPDIDVMQRSWERAVMAPPSERHHTWVALESSAGAEIVVGAAALAPASDPDLDPTSCIELLVFTVDPAHRGQGHGSRLLTAALQTATAAGEREAVVWLAGGDDLLRRFLESAGWAADGAHRTLATDSDDEDAARLRQVRLGTVLASDTP
ncbi:MAG: GNAT family N-acetyltransferase [Actinomycetia bacterium]|nr:GNAT family N-acetyltransferase [Actinomycetes bacterium]